MSDKRKISLKLTQMLNKDAALTLDGDCRTALVENDMVVIKKSDLSLDLIRLKERSFYDILRQKMDKIGRNQP